MSARLRAEFVAALAPPKEPEPIPHTRVRAIKNFKVTFDDRYGEYSAAAGSIVDIPTALLSKLKGRVEVVPPTTEIRGFSLEPWMATDD